MCHPSRPLAAEPRASWPGLPCPQRSASCAGVPSLSPFTVSCAPNSLGPTLESPCPVPRPAQQSPSSRPLQVLCPSSADSAFCAAVCLGEPQADRLTVPRSGHTAPGGQPRDVGRAVGPPEPLPRGPCPESSPAPRTGQSCARVRRPPTPHPQPLPGPSSPGSLFPSALGPVASTPGQALWRATLNVLAGHLMTD